MSPLQDTAQDEQLPWTRRTVETHLQSLSQERLLQMIETIIGYFIVMTVGIVIGILYATAMNTHISRQEEEREFRELVTRWIKEQR